MFQNEHISGIAGDQKQFKFCHTLPKESMFTGLLIIVCLYVFHLENPGVLFKPLFFFSIIGLVLFRGIKVHGILLWGMVSLFFTQLLISKYYVVANHHFVITFMSWSVWWYFLYPSQNKERLGFHFSIMMGLVLFFSAVHKFISPEFRSGSFFLHEMNLGYFLKPFKMLIPEWKQAAESNKQLFIEMMKTPPDAQQNVNMKNVVSGAPKIALWGSYFAIGMELVATLALWIRPASKGTHCIFVITILSIFLLRQETGFLALLTLMAFYLSPGKIFNGIYMLLLTVFATFIATHWGFH